MNEMLAEPPVIRIEPRKGWFAVDWSELWQYREMFYFLTWRDVKVRYKQTVLGAAWAVIQPVLTMMVFWIFLGKLGGIKSGSVPYPVFVYTGLLLWIFFSGIVVGSANSLIGNERLVTKVYFPRLIIPCASVGVGLVDLIIAMFVLVGMIFYYRIGVSAWVLAIPVLIILITAAALGIGLFLCAINVEYRDFKYVIPFLIQLWMFASPVVYPASLIPAEWQQWYALNPLVGLIEGFRAALLNQPMPWHMLSVSAPVCVLMFLFGVVYFRKMEYKFADLI